MSLTSRRRLRPTHASVIAVAALAALAVTRVRVAGASPDEASRCIEVRPEARYRGLGYNHIVHLTDVCKRAAECDVSTDVNPQPTHVTVPPGEKVEVTTFVGSPARVFVPKADCKIQ